uniref:Tetraspanin n=1 Tax=Ascaris lumbricoides TaxID=6252 RepID=A0A9J2PND1_ASCLU
MVLLEVVKICTQKTRLHWDGILAHFGSTTCVILTVTTIRIVLSGSAFIGALLYQIYFFGVLNDASMRVFDSSGKASRSSRIMASSLMFSTNGLCTIAILLLLAETVTVIFSFLKWYYLVGLSESFNNALSFVLLIVCVFNVNLGLHAAEISSTIIGHIAVNIHEDKQLTMSAIDHIQTELHCCGFHTGVNDWIAEITAQFYDPMERKSVIVINNATKRMWFTLCSEDDLCSVPRSCCRMQTENCNKVDVSYLTDKNYTHTNDYEQRMVKSTALYDKSCFSVFEKAVESYSHFTVVVVFFHTLTAVFMEAIITAIISRLNGIGRIDLLTGEVRNSYA